MKISSHSRRIETEFLSSSASGSGGVLSRAFPGALALAAAAQALLGILAALLSGIHEQMAEGKRLMLLAYGGLVLFFEGDESFYRFTVF